jgi:serine/threonine protein kinase
VSEVTKSPFVIDERDVDYILDANPSHAAYARFDEMHSDLEWTMSGTNRKFKKGEHKVKILEYISSGTYGVAFKGTIQSGTNLSQSCVIKMIRFSHTRGLFKDCMIEMMTHFILSRTCESNPDIRAGQDAGRMSRIPKLFAAFTTHAYQFLRAVGTRPVYSTTTKANYFVLVMEPLMETAWAYMQNRVEKVHMPFYAGWTSNDKSVLVNTAYGFLAYQVMNLLYELQNALRFNHRDLHFANVMIKTDPVKSPRCYNTYFESYLIDFGMCRLEYMGKTIVNVSGVYPETFYNPAHDVIFFLRSSRVPMGCNLRTDRKCKFYNAPVNFAYTEILDASGVDFTAPENTSDHTAELYQTIQHCGPAMDSRVLPTPVIRANINNHRTSTRTVLAVFTIILRQLADRCASGTPPFAPFGPADVQEIRDVL